MALCDKTLPDEERQDLAAAIFSNLENWPDQFPVTDSEQPGPRMASGDAFFSGEYSIFQQICYIKVDLSRKQPALPQLVRYPFLPPDLPRHQPAAQ